MVHNGVIVSWRTFIEGRELVELTTAHGGSAEAGWWDRIRPHSLGWVAARTPDHKLVGFVNVAWDGSNHAFLIDTKTHPSHQHQGLGTAVVLHAIAETRAAGCEWLFVDYAPDLAPFYEDACGFTLTRAGLIRLR